MKTYRFKPTVTASHISKLTPLGQGLTRIGFSGNSQDSLDISNEFIEEESVEVGGYLVRLPNHQHVFFAADEFTTKFELVGNSCK